MNKESNGLNKPTNYKKYGWWFIGFSVFTIAIFLTDYKTKWIFQISNLSELGTLISGISGVFAALASLFFILDNLELQRETINTQIELIKIQKEDLELQREDFKLQINENIESNKHLKEQSEIYRYQQTESTFFNLLNNHKVILDQLVISENTGSIAFNKTLKGIASSLEIYKNSLEELRFNNIVYTNYNPQFLYNRYENLDSIFNNICHIILFIIERLNNDKFYHNTLYYSLSNEEKFLLGMVFRNKIFIIKELDFNYSDYYNKNSHYLNQEESGFFPSLEFDLPKSLEITCNEFSDINIGLKSEIERSFKYTLHNSDLIFKKMVFLLKDSVGDGFEIIPKDNSLNIYNLFSDFIFQNFHYINPPNGIDYYFHNVNLIIEYKGIEFVIFVNHFNIRVWRNVNGVSVKVNIYS